MIRLGESGIKERTDAGRSEYWKVNCNSRGVWFEYGTSGPSTQAEKHSSWICINITSGKELRNLGYAFAAQHRGGGMKERKILFKKDGTKM